MKDKNKVIKSRKRSTTEKSNVKSSLANKVKSTEQLASSNKTKSKSTGQSTNSNTNNVPKNDNSKYQPKTKVGSFFFQLSLLGRISLVVWMVLIVSFVILLVPAIAGKGEINYGSRQEPVKVIANEQVNEVKTALEKDIKGDINVDYAGYRFVVVIDLGKGSNLNQAKKINSQAYGIINKILPIKDYFSSTSELNNDLFIYSTDLVPKDYNQESTFIYETYKNSKMAKPQSYDLMSARDKKSYNEVKKTMKDMDKGGK